MPSLLVYLKYEPDNDRGSIDHTHVFPGDVVEFRNSFYATVFVKNDTIKLILVCTNLGEGGEREGGKGEKEGEREERTLSHLFKFPELSKFLPLAKFSQGSQNYQNACKYTKENKHRTRHENYTYMHNATIHIKSTCIHDMYTKKYTLQAGILYVHVHAVYMHMYFYILVDMPLFTIV